MEVLLSIGSNSDGRQKTLLARNYLDCLLTDAVHSEMMETAPIGLVCGPFTNSLTRGSTDLDITSLTTALKRIEKQCGDSRLLRESGIVKMDIDILLYNGIRMHEQDWTRPYIRDNVERFLTDPT